MLTEQQCRAAAEALLRAGTERKVVLSSLARHRAGRQVDYGGLGTTGISFMKA